MSYQRKIDSRRIAWTVHNWIGHPLADALSWSAVIAERLGRPKLAEALDAVADFTHDATSPDAFGYGDDKKTVFR